jgi:hypothetical protein
MLPGHFLQNLKLEFKISQEQSNKVMKRRRNNILIFFSPVDFHANYRTVDLESMTHLGNACSNSSSSSAGIARSFRLGQRLSQDARGTAWILQYEQ